MTFHRILLLICFGFLLIAQPLVAPVQAAPVVGVDNLRATPNPFNPTTSILFEVEGPADCKVPVKVEVFDVRGRQVGMVLDKSLEPGPRAVTWQPIDLNCGVYFARVTAADCALQLTLTLLK